MLQLHHADELDPLLDALAAVLGPSPADPFTPDLVVVPTAGLADAAKVGLGRRLGASDEPGATDGVVANVEFVFPGRFVARALCIGGVGPAADFVVDPWSIEHLTWHVLEELEFGGLVVPGANTSNRWALARRVADLFDRYATQRPRLIQHWAQGQLTDGTYGSNGELVALSADQHWQAQLWQAVRRRIGQPSIPEQLPGLLQAIRQGDVQPDLPQRVSLFGLGSLAPSLLAVLRAVAEVRDMHVFLRHPSRVVWAGAPNRLAGGLVQRALADVTSYVKHPLVESWGRPALEAKALVGGASDINEVGHSPRTVAPAATVLGALQRGIRLDVPPTLDPVLVAADGSLQVHACHGEVRQLEVLRDALGHAFVADPTLQPHEVLVLCGDLERFAPLVEAVFTRGALPVPVRIGDRSLSTADPVGSALQ
ncbi:MAG: exodeoxyribonuclease subunit gamma, partial [Actinomycetota bacterium]